MKCKKLLAFLLAAPLFLSSCIRNNGICYTHTDADKDGICDVCGSKVKVEPSNDPNSTVIPGNPCSEHVDHDLDGTCDVCGANMSAPAHDHIDGDQDGKCDICGASMVICLHHNDANADGLCDHCGAQMPLPTGVVTVYLVLSSVGLYNGQRGDDIPALNLENTVAMSLTVGSLLPGKDTITQGDGTTLYAVTHSYGSATFSHWAAYDGAGAPTVYTKVPAVNNKILYAQFVPNGQAPVTPSTPDTPSIPEDTSTTKAFKLKTSFADGNWQNDSAKILVYCWDDMANSKVYSTSAVDSDYVSFTISTSYTNCLFLRMPQDNNFDPQQWNGVWNQSVDLAITSAVKAKENPVAKITSWDNGAGKCGVAWED